MHNVNTDPKQMSRVTVRERAQCSSRVRRDSEPRSRQQPPATSFEPGGSFQTEGEVWELKLSLSQLSPKPTATTLKTRCYKPGTILEIPKNLQATCCRRPRPEARGHWQRSGDSAAAWERKSTEFPTAEISGDITSLPKNYKRECWTSGGMHFHGDDGEVR